MDEEVHVNCAKLIKLDSCVSHDDSYEEHDPEEGYESAETYGYPFY
jgi:hypothetical protein